MSPCLLFHSDLAGKGFSSGHCRQENRAFAKQAAQARSQQLSQLSPASTPRMAPHCFPSYAPSGSHRKHGAVPQSDPCWFLTSPTRAEGQAELPKPRRDLVFSVSPPPGTPGPVEGQAEGSNCASHAHLSGRVPTACSLLSVRFKRLCSSVPILPSPASPAARHTHKRPCLSIYVHGFIFPLPPLSQRGSQFPFNLSKPRRPLQHPA